VAEVCLRVLQITDMHLQETPDIELRGVNPEQRFLSVLNHLRTEEADMLLLTGDLSHHSIPAYTRLSDYLQQLDIPSYWIPGNHDLSGEMFRFAEQGYGTKSIDLSGWRILMLDSTSMPDGRGGGALSEPELQFLRTELDEAAEELNILLVLHHNPVSVDSRWQDSIMLANADQFWSTVNCYPQVKGVVFGHVHQTWALERDGVKLFSAPATAAQFKSRTERPETEDNHELSGPAYATYELCDDGTITQKVRRLLV